MEMDDHLCLCFHVSKRKVVNFIRIEKPLRVAQLSECHGAGTGCGVPTIFEKPVRATERQSPAGASIESSRDAIGS